MASTYNVRLPAPEILVKGQEFAVVRTRPTYDELQAPEGFPDWLQDGLEAKGAA